MSSRPCRSASLASICCPVLLISNVLLLHLLGRKSCDAESLSTLDVPVGILPRTDCRGFKYPPSALVVPHAGSSPFFSVLFLSCCWWTRPGRRHCAHRLGASAFLVDRYVPLVFQLLRLSMLSIIPGQVGIRDRGWIVSVGS